MNKYLVTFVFIFLFYQVEIFASEAVKDYSQYNELKLDNNDFITGSDKAKVTVIEYSSLSCPHCSDFHRNTYDDFKKKYIDTGLVKYVYRDFPTNHPALLGAMLAHCAGNDKYYTYINTLMNSQGMWAYHNNFQDSLINIAKLGGIPDDNIKNCFADKALEEKLLKRAMNAAKSLQIDSTPTFFINGDKYSGAKSFKEFSKIIDDKLNAKGK